MFSIFSYFLKVHKNLLSFKKRHLKDRVDFRICVFLFLFICTPWSYAVRVNKISVKGNKIIETELIRSHIQLKEGSSYNKKTIQKDVRQLFSLGFFDDIEVRSSSSKKGLNILYQVKERIHIGKVEFKGNDNIKTEDLQSLSLVKEHGFLNFSELQKTTFAIKEKYKEKGYYLAEVSYKTEKIPKKNKLKLIIEIKENKQLFIKRINFIGNRNISSNELKTFMQTKEHNLLSFLGSSGTFNPEHINRDLQFLEYYYRDKGYLSVRVQKPEINITPDKKFLYINFSISEGSKFKLGQVIFHGDEIVPAQQVMDQLKLKKEEYFSLGKLQEDIKFISVLYKNKGYAFVEVKPILSPDKLEENKIHVLFKVEKGDIYKVGRIHIQGNKNARDKVILRRFHIREGDLYNESKKELTRQLLQQLGYFEKVHLKPTPSETTKGELDLTVNVKERENTGEAFLSGGHSGATRLFIKAGVKKQNFLGLDQSVALNVNFNKYQEIFTFNYTNPYFFDSNWSFAFDIFNVAQDTFSGANSLFYSQDYYSYSQLDTGFSISLGRHLSEVSTVFLKYQLQKQSLSEDSIYFLRDLPVLSPVFKFLFGGKEENNRQKQTKSENLKEDKDKLKGQSDKQKISEEDKAEESSEPLQTVTFSDIYNLEEGRGINSSLSVILEYDKRNDRYYASKGFFTRLSAEYSGLGGDFDYTKLQGKFHHYYSPFWKFVIKNRLDYGLVFSNDKEKKIPFTELFLLGGPYDLRGFNINSQGPRKRSNMALQYAKENNLPNPEAFAERPYGGSQMFFYSLELEFPLIEQMELRGAFFFDLGEANNKLLFDLNDQLRANVGFGVRWKSPFGPVSLDWALPYRPRKELLEEDWKFQFNFGYLL